MGYSAYPAPSSGGIKSVQRGSAAGSGNVTITAVNIAKSFVTVYGTTSSGTVAASGTVGSSSLTYMGVSQIHVNNNNAFFRPNNASFTTSTAGGANAGNESHWNANATINSTNLSGGSNNLVAAVVQGYLQDSTTLVVSGPCRWEVVEFN